MRKLVVLQEDRDCMCRDTSQREKKGTEKGKGGRKEGAIRKHAYCAARKSRAEAGIIEDVCGQGI